MIGTDCRLDLIMGVNRNRKIISAGSVMVWCDHTVTTQESNIFVQTACPEVLYIILQYHSLLIEE